MTIRAGMVYRAECMRFTCVAAFERWGFFSGIVDTGFITYMNVFLVLSAQVPREGRVWEWGNSRIAAFCLFVLFLKTVFLCIALLSGNSLCRSVCPQTQEICLALPHHRWTMKLQLFI